MEDIARAIDKLASAVYSLGGTIAFIGILFLIFKNMGGKDKVAMHHIFKDKPEDD
jgi:hypothetical protein